MSTINNDFIEIDKLLRKSKNNQNRCLNIIKRYNTKNNYIDFIKKYVGPDGLITFEHNFNKHIDNFNNLWGVDENHIYDGKTYLSIIKLSINQLQTICQQLIKYAFYCKYMA